MKASDVKLGVNWENKVCNLLQSEADCDCVLVCACACAFEYLQECVHRGGFWKFIAALKLDCQRLCDSGTIFKRVAIM